MTPPTPKPNDFSDFAERVKSKHNEKHPNYWTYNAEALLLLAWDEVQKAAEEDKKKYGAIFTQDTIDMNAAAQRIEDLEREKRATRREVLEEVEREITKLEFPHYHLTRQYGWERCKVAAIDILNKLKP